MTHRWTVRARLTALYGSLFVLAGAALLGITYLLLQQALGDQLIDRQLVFRAEGAIGPVSGPVAASVPATLPLPEGLTPDQRTAALGRLQLAETLQQDFRDRTLTTLLQRGAMALGAVALVGIWLGWLAAGRTLRPIQQITATARRVADRSLHERIALTGPRDELKQLADTFDDMLERLDASFDSQRRFVANASHELRTPLAINRTLLEVALSRPDAPPALHQLGGTLLEVNARHERLIDGLLVLASSEQTIADPAPVDLADVAGRLVEGACPGAAVAVTLDAAPAVVAGDAVLLERLTQNLVANAVAYNRPAGRVAVTVGPGPSGVRLTVANTGPPIAAYEVPGLFEPFRRLTDRVGSARGTGLGLSIVRSVARAHGGEATAAPGPDGGLTVTVDLPAAPVSRARPASPAAPPGGP
ncbi:sensor histidine kinase [Spirilliplanes yamanashiensis]|uniref:histidine kinase n=1 Tax=Spirilliplanes yamanashiensis TaxID=42233 RepID=A0A8J3Y514_9ACTN|nr:ATP-binding protein [Spirilliplanes yamanashiensis]MDP9819569.1 signal transduction histidine kinase [Spirilliplanes yamanashiensis]GIJ01609.1 two-component sensor histidine kinase [Spirilliplanes yamanashiensis]